MAYIDLKYLPRRKASDKVLRDKAFNIAKNPKYYWHQCGIASIVYKFFDNYSCSPNTSGDAIKSETIPNQKLTEQLHDPIVKKLKYVKYTHPSKTIYLVLGLRGIKLIRKFNKNIRFLLYVIDVYSKNARVVSLKDKKGFTITNAY